MAGLEQRIFSMTGKACRASREAASIHAGHEPQDSGRTQFVRQAARSRLGEGSGDRVAFAARAIQRDET